MFLLHCFEEGAEGQLLAATARWTLFVFFRHLWLFVILCAR